MREGQNYEGCVYALRVYDYTNILVLYIFTYLTIPKIMMTTSTYTTTFICI